MNRDPTQAGEVALRPYASQTQASLAWKETRWHAPQQSWDPAYHLVLMLCDLHACPCHGPYDHGVFSALEGLA